MKAKIIGLVLIIIAVSTAAITAYYNNPKRQVPIVFSNNFMLNELWEGYKTEYLENGTWRTVDKQNKNITTSEGQSYTMMRAVWQGDRETFDRAFAWAQSSLNRYTDKLFAWKFGQKQDGNFGILSDEGGNNTASDADVDIAFALVLGYSRWQDDKYLSQARLIINDIWEKEVVIVNNQPILAANNLEKFSTIPNIIVNVSYFAPYAYKLFAKIDKKHDWNKLVDSSYSILEKSMTSHLDTGKSANLFPDWIHIDRNTGEIKATNIPGLTTNYSYDAFRTPWRLALDWKWNKEPRAKQTLEKMTLLEEEWKSKSLIYPSYSHDGRALVDYEAPGAYGANIGYFIVTESPYAEEIYNKKLKSLYSPETQSLKDPLSYYDDNWVWFGIALYQNRLINLTEGINFKAE